MNRPLWAELNLSALAHNARAIHAHCPNIPIFAVVKRDAYGHGLIPVAQTLQKEGVHHFAVASLDEAVLLREAGVQGEILVLGYTPPEQAPLLAHHRISQSIFCEEMWEEWKEAISTFPLFFHLKIDTGMNRLGWKNAKNMREKVHPFLPRLRSIFTHLPRADEDWEYTLEQVNRFHRIARPFAEKKIPLHCVNSSFLLQSLRRGRKPPGNFLRLGILLYGVSPMQDISFPLRAALSVKTRIIQVKHVKKGEGVSYGHTWKARRNSVIAIVPIGYSDGYPRVLSNSGKMVVEGKIAPIVGRVTMDYTLLDITEIPGANRGSEVVVLGDGMTAWEVAQDAGTIPYEVLCSLGSRIPRIISPAESR
ncbi:MAG: alanine racemase [bacterium JZ-2024 1]